MLKRIMFGLIVGFYCAEPAESEFSPALEAIFRYLRHLVCVLYALPAADIGANSKGIPIPSSVPCAEIDGPRHDLIGRDR
jgi:hypothetical protein